MSYALRLTLWPRTHGNVFLRFCIVSSNELVVLDSLEYSKQYKNAGKRFRVHGAYDIVHYYVNYYNRSEIVLLNP